MKRVLVLQSAPEKRPEWISEAMHTVHSWASLRGFDYQFVGDEIFTRSAEFAGGRFSKVTLSDLCRLCLIEENLNLGYDYVYWIDADVVIWNRRDFDIPEITPGEIACPREAWVYDRGNVTLQWNNSIVGLCDREDAKIMIDISHATLVSNSAKRVRETIIGTDLFSSRDFPLRKVEIKQACTLSPESIRRVLGPWVEGRRHLAELSLAHGATLAAANLCSSQKQDADAMLKLVHQLIRWPHIDLGQWRRLAPLARLLMRAGNLPDCMRCWIITRFRFLRTAISG